MIAKAKRHLGRVSPKSWRGLAALLAPFVLGCGFVLGSDASETITAERIQHEVLALGALGSLGFLLACSVRPLLVVISGSLFAIAAGLVWGPIWGTLLALGGSVLSAWIVFGLARIFGSGAVRDVAGERYGPLSAMAQSRGFAFVFVATLGFLFPTDLVIAVSAATGVRARTVLLATTLGTFPGTLAMVVMGSTALKPGAATWWLGGGAVIGLTLVAALLAKVWFPRAGRRAAARVSSPA